MIHFPSPLARAQSWAMDHDSYPDAFLRDILTGVRAIAVNPFAAGGMILGERCYGALDEIGEPIDMVDVFRRSEAAGAAVDQAISVGAKIVWMQLGVRDDAAATRAEAAGLKVVMNRDRKSTRLNSSHSQISYA